MRLVAAPWSTVIVRSVVCEAKASDVILEVAIDKISSLRYDFNVEDPDEVRNIQRILGLEEDGIFGPKTNRTRVGVSTSIPLSS